MTDFLLVHGAWHGGWCWNRLRPLLEARGHRVWTPTLTGLGEREHLLTREVGLETHVQDIVKVLEFEDLRDVVLVAHSYGGVPATVVADRCGERLAAVIYLDAALPRHGQSAFDAFPGTERESRDAIDGPGLGWLIPPMNHDFGIRSAVDLEWVRQRLRPHPLRSFQDPVLLSSQRTAVPAAAIICAEDAGADAAQARGFSTIPVVWIDAGHDVMITDPFLVADTLAELLLNRL